MAAMVDTVPWDQLQHAYGPASDIPPLLRQIAAARGPKLFEALEELCSRVLHQGTIYSASPPVARAVLEMLRNAAPREKVMFYGLLAGFADSARKAIEDGRAIPCCAGGDPADGAAIRLQILDARSWFVQDLAHPDAPLRGHAAELLTAFAEADPATARLVRDRYFVENDSTVRHTILDGLVRVRASFDDWPGFLTAALDRETDPANRFSLRHAQLCETKSAADSASLDELVSTFAQASASDEYGPDGNQRFLEAVHLLGTERELAAMLKALELVHDHDQLRVLAERLLRLAFGDQRTGWGQTSYSRLNEGGSRPPGASLGKMLLRSIGLLILWKLAPFLLRRKIRRMAGSEQKGLQKIDYWGLEGVAPSIPPRLSETQRTVLTACAAKPALWQFRTNLWQLFGLPDTANELRRFVAEHS